MKNRKPKGYWKVKENAIAEAMKVMEEHELDSLPSWDKLHKLGYHGLCNAINKHHGGFYRFRELLGQEQLRVKKGSWKDLNYCLDEAMKVMEEHGLDILPSASKLKKLGYIGLNHAIYGYHGGYHKFRELLGEEQKRTKHGSWKDFDFTLEQARKFMRENGFDKLPGSWTIRKLGYFGLNRAINTYHGGIAAFRAKLNDHLGIKSEKEKLEELLGDYAGE